MYLLNYVVQNENEIKELKRHIHEMREVMEGLMGRGPDNLSPSSSETSTTNVQENTTTIPGEKKESPPTPQETDQIAPVLRDTCTSQYSSNSEIALPLFDEDTVSPVFHLKQLDDYMRLRNIPEEIKLTLAYRSSVGETSRVWVETMTKQIHDYPTFKRELLKMWWSPSKQSTVRCQLYQGRCNQQLKLSPSAYFLKQVTIVSYLEPKPSEIEIVEALRCHYPKRIELLNIQEQKDHTSTRNFNPTRGERNVRYTCSDTRPANRNPRNTYHFNARKGEQYRPRANVYNENIHPNRTENSWDKDHQRNPKGKDESSGN
jgi:hypothetical protein